MSKITGNVAKIAYTCAGKVAHFYNKDDGKLYARGIVFGYVEDNGYGDGEVLCIKDNDYADGDRATSLTIEHYGKNLIKVAPVDINEQINGMFIKHFDIYTGCDKREIEKLIEILEL